MTVWIEASQMVDVDIRMRDDVVGVEVEYYEKVGFVFLTQFWLSIQDFSGTRRNSSNNRR